MTAECNSRAKPVGSSHGLDARTHATEWSERQHKLLKTNYLNKE